MNNPTKGTIGQAIDQTMSALATLEKREQQIVISTICSLLDIAPSVARPGPAPTYAAAAHATAPHPHSADAAPKQAEPPKAHHAVAHGESDDDHGVDIRTLRNQKQPASAQQMACVVAYYLQEYAPREERTKEVSTADLERLFKQAGFKLPSRMQQVLVDAKTAGYFESVDRGKYRLTRVGYNLVTHSLPKAAAT